MKTKDVHKSLWDAIYASNYEKIRKLLTQHKPLLTTNENNETLFDYALIKNDAQLLKIALEFYPEYYLNSHAKKVIWSDNEKISKLLYLLLNNNYFDELTKIIEFLLNRLYNRLFEFNSIIEESVNCGQLDKLLQFFIDYNKKTLDKIILSEMVNTESLKTYLNKFYSQLPDDKKLKFILFIYSKECFKILNIGLIEHFDLLMKESSNLDNEAIIKSHFSDDELLNLIILKIYMGNKLNSSDLMYIKNLFLKENNNKINYEFIINIKNNNGDNIVVKILESEKLTLSEKKDILEIISKKVGIEVIDLINKTPDLLIKIINSNLNVWEKHNIINYLIKIGINLNSINKEGDTALNVAFYQVLNYGYYEYIEIIKLLFANDAYVTNNLTSLSMSQLRNFDQEILWYFIYSLSKKNLNDFKYTYTISLLLKEYFSLEIYDIIQEHLNNASKVVFLSKLLINVLEKRNFSLADEILIKNNSLKEKLINKVLIQFSNDYDIPVIEFLLNHYQQDCDLNKLNLNILNDAIVKDQEKVFSYLLNKNFIKKKLKDKNYLINIFRSLLNICPTEKKHFPYYIDYLITNGIIDNMDKDISTMLMFLYLEIEEIPLFIKQLEIGFNPDITDGDNNTILMKIILKIISEENIELKSSIIKKIINSGICLNVVNNSGETVLTLINNNWKNIPSSIRKIIRDNQ